LARKVNNIYSQQCISSLAHLTYAYILNKNSRARNIPNLRNMPITQVEQKQTIYKVTRLK